MQDTWEPRILISNISYYWAFPGISTRQRGNASRNPGLHHWGLCQKRSATRCPPSSPQEMLRTNHRILVSNPLSLHDSSVSPSSSSQPFPLPVPPAPCGYYILSLTNSPKFFTPFLILPPSPFHPKRNIFMTLNICFHSIDLSEGHSPPHPSAGPSPPSPHN